MKFAKITLSIIIGLIAIIWIVGVVGGEAEYKVSVKAKAPIEIAWSVFTDDSLTTQWLIGLKSIERIEGLPFTAGSKFRLIFEENGNRFEMIETMTSVVPNSQFAFEADSDIMFSNTDIQFTQDGEYTVITDNSHFEAKGFVFKALLPLMSNTMAERSELMYTKLADLIEAAAYESVSDTTNSLE